jgi:hypothetical protein
MSKDISNYNSLKNQQKQSEVFKKYNKLLKSKPSTLQQYYYYLQNKQPELDELNYLSNAQVANAKNEVEKQLENAVMLKDKFKANLEADKERAKLETQQRNIRQREIFAQELFDAQTREAKTNLAEKLQGAIKARKARDEKTNLELDQIRRERTQQRIRMRMPEIIRANEAYNKDYLKREKAQEALTSFANEAKQIAASKILQGAARGIKAKAEYKMIKEMNEPVRNIINRIEASRTVENPKQQFELSRGTQRQPRNPQLRLTNG